MISVLCVEDRWWRETVTAEMEVTAAHAFWDLLGTVGTSCISSAQPPWEAGAAVGSIL